MPEQPPDDAPRPEAPAAGAGGAGTAAASSTGPQRLCASTDLAEGQALGFEVQQWGRVVPAFAVRVDGQVAAFLNRCVHVPVEMDWQPGQFLDAERRWIVCSIHGATYHPHTGGCVGGPCGRGRLTPVTVVEKDGWVDWYPSETIRPPERSA